MSGHEDVLLPSSIRHGRVPRMHGRVDAELRSGELGFGISQIQVNCFFCLLDLSCFEAGELMMGCGICDGSTTKASLSSFV